jgi:hypothetical protein
MPRPKQVDKEKKVRTSVSIPESLYEEARSFVDKRVSPADSINSFVVAAILAYVKLIRRKQIDAQFAAMLEDSEYQQEAKVIAEEFSQSDWEAFQSAEKGF